MPGLPELEVARVVVPLLAWALLDAALRPVSSYRAIGRSKAGWLLAVLVLPTIGPLLYLLVVRRRLRAAQP